MTIDICTMPVYLILLDVLLHETLKQTRDLLNAKTDNIYIKGKKRALF